MSCVPSGSVVSSDAPFCQYSVEVLVSISFGSKPSWRKSAPVLAGDRIVQRRGREREFVLGHEVVLMLRVGAERLAEFGIEEDAADAARCA